MAFIDFGFLEPGLLAAIPRVAKQGGKLPESVNGKLAVRVTMGYDGRASGGTDAIRFGTGIGEGDLSVRRRERYAEIVDAKRRRRR